MLLWSSLSIQTMSADRHIRKFLQNSSSSNELSAALDNYSFLDNLSKGNIP
jgi:hypothetical protein